MGHFIVANRKSLTQNNKNSFYFEELKLDFVYIARKIKHTEDLRLPTELVLLKTEAEESKVRSLVSSIKAEYVGEILDLPSFLKEGNWTPKKEVSTTPIQTASMPSISFSIESLKRSKCEKIDAKTSILIERGYDYGDVTLSTSYYAQLKWASLYASRGVTSYPKTIPNKDNTKFLTVKDALEVEDIYIGMTTVIASYVDAGTELKRLVNEANTSEQVNSVLDNRE